MYLFLHGESGNAVTRGQHENVQLQCPIFALGVATHKNCASQDAQCPSYFPFFRAAAQY